MKMFNEKARKYVIIFFIKYINSDRKHKYSCNFYFFKSYVYVLLLYSYCLRTLVSIIVNYLFVKFVNDVYENLNLNDLYFRVIIKGTLI